MLSALQTGGGLARQRAGSTFRYTVFTGAQVRAVATEERHHDRREPGDQSRDTRSSLGLVLVCSAYGLHGSGTGPAAAARQDELSVLAKSPATRSSTGTGSVPVPKNAPTYTKDIAAILQAKCQSCHRRHQVGPFALETYEQARKRSHDIAFVTEERSMPPWKPTRGVGPKLKHDQSLTPSGDRACSPPGPRQAPRWATPRICRRRARSPRAGSSGRPT